MREFFRGWRKKAGCVMLMMALAVVGAWGRSLYSFDVLNSPIGQENAIAITSWKEMFAIRIGWDQHDSWSEFVWRTFDGDQFEYTDSNSEFYRFEQPIPDGSG